MLTIKSDFPFSLQAKNRRLPHDFKSERKILLNEESSGIRSKQEQNIKRIRRLHLCKLNGKSLFMHNDISSTLLKEKKFFVQLFTYNCINWFLPTEEIFF